MRVLITGGFGFIGRALIKRLVRDGVNEIVVVDKLSQQVHGVEPDHSDLLRLDPVRFVHADICGEGVLQSALAGVDVVYHLAAETGTGQSMYEIENYFQSNVMGTAVLLEEIVRNPDLRPKHLVLASSRSVYGEGAYVLASEVENPSAKRFYPDARATVDMQAGRFDFSEGDQKLAAVPTLETDALRPKSLYAASKLTQEHMCQIAFQSLGLGFTALRFQNVYGPGQSLRNPYTGILSIFTNILRQGGSIDIFEDGLESRDFVYVDDVVSAMVAAPSRDRSAPDVINVGSGVPTSVSDLVARLHTKLGVPNRSVISGRFRPGDIRHCFADTTRLRDVLNLVDLIPLEEGVSRTVDWALTQPVEQDRSVQATRELTAFFGSNS